MIRKYLAIRKREFDSVALRCWTLCAHTLPARKAVHRRSSIELFRSRLGAVQGRTSATDWRMLHVPEFAESFHPAAFILCTATAFRGCSNAELGNDLWNGGGT